MTNGIEEVHQDMVGTIKRHAGLGMALVAFRLRPIKGWGWTLFSGIAALALGIMIWRQFPVSGMWAVGTLAGIHMIFAGWSMTSLSRAARSTAKEAQAA